jgi:hypothetical protein
MVAHHQIFFLSVTALPPDFPKPALLLPVSLVEHTFHSSSHDDLSST